MRRRGWSAAEVVLGAAVVIGHNVYRVVPNEVLVLVVVAILSFRLRDGRWLPEGLRRPEPWRRILLIAVGAVALRNLLGELVILPLGARLWPQPETLPEGADAITGNWGQALLALVFVWAFAAFGEETVYRGYLLPRGADVLGKTKAAWWMAAVLASVLFGIGHYYKGPAGMIDSGVAGLIFGAAYLLAGRNLWACILAHGLHDTLAVAWAFFGLDG